MSSQWRRTVTPVALAIISLFAAVAIWVAVTDAENPEETYEFGAGLVVRAVNVPQGLAVRSIQEDVVFIQVRTTRNVCGDPQPGEGRQCAGELTTADFVAEVNMAAEREETSTKRVFVRVVNRDDVEIVSVSPSTVEVVLEEEATKQVPVQVNRQGSAPQGVAITSVSQSPVTVRVTGARSLIERVESAAVDVNVTGLRVSQQQQRPLAARDSSGADVRPVRIEPSNAEVRIAVTQVEVSWGVTVSVQTRGTVAEGYNLVQVTPDPPLITVQGPVELVQAITSLPTQEIDLGNLRSTQTRNVTLQLPGNVRATRDSVNVTLRIEPAQGSFALAVAPAPVNLGPGLRTTLQTTSVTVRVRGEVPTLNALSPGAVRATVDVGGLGEGVHVLDARVTLPQGVTLESVEPAQVVVIISRE